jgi:RNA polymerase sigma-70 factor (ECF subfamily)
VNTGHGLAADGVRAGEETRTSQPSPARRRTSADRGRAGRRVREAVCTPAKESSAEHAYTDLVARYGEPVRAYLLRLTRNRNVADDVYQETLLKAWRHRHSLIGREGSVRSWLYTVAHNAAVDLMRGRRAQPVTGEIWDSLQPPVPDHADAVVTTAALLPALRRLSAEQRVVLFELYYRRSTVIEAARAIGIPPGTVKSRAHYAVRALRAELMPSAVAHDTMYLS